MRVFFRFGILNPTLVEFAHANLTRFVLVLRFGLDSLRVLVCANSDKIWSIMSNLAANHYIAPGRQKGEPSVSVRLPRLAKPPPQNIRGPLCARMKKMR